MSERRAYPSVDEVALAGLLHDVGKLVQRALQPGDMPAHVRARAGEVLPVRNGHFVQWHALWTDVFFDRILAEGLAWPQGVDGAWVRDLAVHHHRPLAGERALPGLAVTRLIAAANEAASGLAARTGDAAAQSDRSQTLRREPIRALMSTVRPPVGGRVRMCAEPAVHLPAPLGPEAILPLAPHEAHGDDVEEGYRRLWEAFGAQWKDLLRRADGDRRAFEEGLLSLSERLLWAVPASSVEQPDVSLHDHSRTVAALAVCLWRHHQARGETAEPAQFADGARPRLRFLVGDLSGLQRTLFRLRSEQVKGLNRILRGRSQRFALIADAAVRRVLDALDLPMACALQSAGGRFLVLVPDLPDRAVDDTVDVLQRDFDAWLAHAYTGDLGLGLALSRPVATDDLLDPARTRQVFDDLRCTAEEAKLRQLAGPAETGILEVSYPNGVCSACGLRPAETQQPPAGEGHCSACAAEHAIGRRWPKVTAVTVSTRATDEDTDTIFGLGYRIVVDGQATGAGRGWRLREHGEGPAAVRPGKPYVDLYGTDTDHYVRELGDDAGDVFPGGVKTFMALALDAQETLGDGQRVGRRMLGLLKADVDRLGLLFGAGLETADGTPPSLARRAALSRTVDSYFAVRLPWVLSQAFPRSYTVYAGGDDLAIVAPWRDALGLAAGLRRDFAAFTHENPAVTLSAGVALADPRTPLSTVAREAEERLEAAKDAGRDRVSAVLSASVSPEADGAVASADPCEMWQPLGWERYGRLLAAAETVNDWIRQGAISSAALYRLLDFDDARSRVVTGRSNEDDLLWKARLRYQLVRTLPDMTRPGHEHARMADQIMALIEGGETPDGAGGPSGARLALSHAIYRNR